MNEITLTLKDFKLLDNLWIPEIVFLKLLFNKEEELFKELYSKGGKSLISNYAVALENKQYIKILGNDYGSIDNYAVRVKTEELFKEEKADNKSFDEFWNKYHEITKTLKTDKVPTIKYWRGLTKKERTLAYNNIQSYFNSLTDKKYCKKARTYLSDKNFLDEFKQKQTTSTFTKDI